MPSAIRAPDQLTRFRGPYNRGARIRTGDLCDPNAALYRTEPHPGLLGYLQKNGRGRIHGAWRRALACHRYRCFA